MQNELPATTADQTDTNQVDEQTFSHWASKRMALYQAMEQQAQTSIAHILQMASEFTVRMEEETNQFLTRYRQEREAQQAQLEALHQEMDALRAKMAQEQQAQIEQLESRRKQEEEQIAQQRQQALAEIERLRASAQAERAQLLNAAYAERDKVVAETRRLSGRLSELQQALQGLLGAVAPAAAAAAAPEVSQAYVAEPAPPPAPAAPEVSQAYVAEPAPPPAAAAPETTRLYVAEPVVEADPKLTQQLNAVPVRTGIAEADADVVAASTDAGEIAADTDADATEESSRRLIVEDVKSFTSASDLIDRLERSQTITEVNLLQYEEETLFLSVRQVGDGSVETVLENELGDALEMVNADPEVIRLRSRL